MRFIPTNRGVPFRAGSGLLVAVFVLLVGVALGGALAVSSARVVRHGSRSVCRRFAAQERRETRRAERRESAAVVRRERRRVRRCRVPRAGKPTPPGGSPGVGGPGVGGQPAGVVELPVSFKVQNKNDSKVACPSDGAAYTVRGHLVAPKAALAPGRSSARAVTLYLHGSATGELLDWHFAAVPGYDFALELAKAGHVSVTIDRLGFGASGLPDGNQVCIGSEADVTHQVVAALRSGDYAIAGGVAPRFRRVAEGAISFGGAIATVEAYSFNDIDALIVFGTAFDQGLSPAATQDLATNPNGPLQVCPRGGDPKFPDGHGPGNYTYVFKGRTDLVFYNADPTVKEVFLRAWEREPCGEGASLAATLAADRQFLGDITVPVLLVFGDHDAAFPPPDGERQKALYTGSQDVTLIQPDNTGHAIPLERTAPASRAAASDWLNARGF